MRKNTLAGLVVAAALSLFLTARKDTNTLHENGQLKGQVTELQKENGQVNEGERCALGRDSGHEIEALRNGTRKHRRR